MGDLDRKVGFNILIQDGFTAAPNFGTLAIFAHHGLGPQRRVYETSPTGRSGMVVDGLSLRHYAYLASAAIGGQDTKVKDFKLYNRAAPNAQAYTLTPTNIAEGVKYDFALNGIAISHTNGAAETVALIATALQTQLNAVANTTAADNTTDVGLSLTVATGDRMYFKGVPEWLTIKDTSPDAGIVADLNAGLLEDPDFFGVLIDSMCEVELNAAAAWCLANGKIFHGQAIDSDMLTSDTDDVGSDLQGALNTWANVSYSNDPGVPLAAAIMGRQFSLDPGASTWENQTLPGVTADQLSPTQISNALGKNIGLYLPLGTTAATHEFKAASGRFFDFTRDLAWLNAISQARVVSYLLAHEKVPFTQAGLDALQFEVEAAFGQAEDAGVLDEGWKITFPTIGQIPAAEKASRRLTVADFSEGTFQGAVHGVDFSGGLSI